MANEKKCVAEVAAVSPSTSVLPQDLAELQDARAGYFSAWRRFADDVVAFHRGDRFARLSELDTRIAASMSRLEDALARIERSWAGASLPSAVVGWIGALRSAIRLNLVSAGHTAAFRDGLSDTGNGLEFVRSVRVLGERYEAVARALPSMPAAVAALPLRSAELAGDRQSDAVAERAQVPPPSVGSEKPGGGRVTSCDDARVVEGLLLVKDGWKTKAAAEKAGLTPKQLRYRVEELGGVRHLRGLSEQSFRNVGSPDGLPVDGQSGRKKANGRTMW